MKSRSQREFDMKPKSYKCKFCDMIFLNSIELTVHEINIHVDKLYQCQSCYKILRNADKFNEHIKRVHSRSAPSLYSSFESGSPTSNNIGKYNAHEEGLESTLLTQANRSEKAHKRTRGPYRKSHRFDDLRK